MKSYTDLEQSKKLTEILSTESADTIWDLTNPDLPTIRAIPYEDSDYRNKYLNIMPCWSLAALLSVLDFPSLTQNKEDEWEVCVPNHQSDGYIEVSASNPVDACVAMVEKLHELKLL